MYALIENIHNHESSHIINGQYIVCVNKSDLLQVVRVLSPLTPQNLSIEICVQKIFSINIYVKIALTKKKKIKK